MNRHKGFTLIELLIVIGITVLLVASASPLYTNLQVSAQINDTAAQVVQTIRLARERSVAGFNNASHGVYFEHVPGARARYILYQGSSYPAREAGYDRAAVLPESLSLRTTFAADLWFSKGLGVPNATGTVVLSHSTGDVRKIFIYAMGATEED